MKVRAKAIYVYNAAGWDTFDARTNLVDLTKVIVTNETAVEEKAA